MSKVWRKSKYLATVKSVMNVRALVIKQPLEVKASLVSRHSLLNAGSRAASEAACRLAGRPEGESHLFDYY